ncbi:C-factor-like [Mauremys reevesii]|uniref:C-factor-like n=1 Tax=Mauremys reevesii TaxID=260615 RepID=UPI00193F5517|nr:C-factor-like [Mauremys reevesii]
MKEFNVRSVLVTGSNRGIGLGLVKRFLELPSPPEWIFATTRELDESQSKEVIELALKHSNLVVLQMDVTDPNSIKAAAQRVEEHVQGHGLNLLINNAGITQVTTMENENVETMAIVYLTNTVGPLMVSQEFLPLLKKAAQQSAQTGLSCSIVNMSSMAGSIALVTSLEFLQEPSYRCSKAALNMVSKCQSLEYKDYGILCTSIHPGWVKTRMGTEKAPQTVEQTTQAILKMLSTLYEKENGSFVGWDGQIYPW